MSGWCGEVVSVISAVLIYHGCQPGQALLRERGLHSKALPIVDIFQPRSLFLILHLTCCLAPGSSSHHSFSPAFPPLSLLADLRVVIQNTEAGLVDEKPLPAFHGLLLPQLMFYLPPLTLWVLTVCLAPWLLLGTEAVLWSPLTLTHT